MNLRIGCCGFPVGRQQYYEKFKVVELQKSFYQPPKIETAIKWRESAPSDFEFTHAPESHGCEPVDEWLSVRGKTVEPHIKGLAAYYPSCL